MAGNGQDVVAQAIAEMRADMAQRFGAIEQRLGHIEQPPRRAPLRHEPPLRQQNLESDEENEPPPRHHNSEISIEEEGPNDGDPEPEPPDQVQANNIRTYTTKTGLSLNNGYKYFGPKLFWFSGADYIQWERNMDTYFTYHYIPREEKFPIALKQLTGGALKWWTKEASERWYYKEPTIRTWEELKWLMYKRYVPQELLQSHQTVPPLKEANRLPFHTKPALAREHVHRPKPKKQVKRGSRSLLFSGTSKDPEVYLQWESNMEEWLQSNNFSKEQKLTQAVSAITKKAYEWWLKESAPTIYKKPVLDWRDLKARMHKEFVEKHQATPTRVSSTSTTDLPTVSLNESFTMWEEQAELVTPWFKSMKEKEMIDTKEQIGQDLEIDPKDQRELILPPNDMVQTETCHVVYDNPMTALTHLSSAQKVENVSGTKEINSDQEEGSKETKEFLDQLQNHEATTPMVDEATAQEDENVNGITQIKEEFTKKLHQVSTPLIRFNSNNLNMVMIKLLSPEKCEKNIGSLKKLMDPNCCFETQANMEQGTVMLHANKMFQIKTCLYTYVDSMTVIMHLFLAKSVDIIVGTNHEDHKKESMKKKLSLDKTQNQGTSTSMLIQYETMKGESATNIFQLKENPPDSHLQVKFKKDIKHSPPKTTAPNQIRGDEVPTTYKFKEKNIPPGQSRDVILSYLIKGEPPVAPHTTKPSQYQGKTLNSQRRMKANLLSLGADYIVSRSKPFQERV